MSSCSKRRRHTKLIPIDPTQLTPIAQQQQPSKQNNRQNEHVIHPKNLLNVTKNKTNNQINKLIHLQPHSALNPSTSQPPIPQPSNQSSIHNTQLQSTPSSSTNQSNLMLLWSDRFFPTHPSELAIHPKKLESIHTWLNDSLNGPNHIKRYRRLLVVSGPTGSGKSSMIHSFSSDPAAGASSHVQNTSQRVILPIKSRAKKPAPCPAINSSPPLQGIGYEILEWRNTGNESSSSKSQEFSAWLMRATAAPALSFREEDEATQTEILPNKHEEQNARHYKLKERSRRVILVDDLPNLYHQDTLKNFQTSIRFHLNSARPSTPPLIIIMTDTTCKTGEDGLNDSLLNGNQSYQNQDKPLNVHNFLPLDILNHPACYLIKLQPVNKTLMKKFISRLIDQYHHSQDNSNSSTNTRFHKLSAKQIDLIMDSSAGDLRSALNNLQQYFLNSSSLGNPPPNPKLPSSFNINHNLNRHLLSYRDESLVIFHGLGKILYNKRWGDDPIDDAKDKRICGPKLDKLPPFWMDFERRLAKTDVDKLYSDLSVSIQHFIVYLHHNYPQFLNSIEEGSFWLEYLSLTDSNSLSLNGNNRYNQTSISEFYRFHVASRSILLGLPTPVIRRSQKFYKPVLWDNLKSINSNQTLLDSFRDRRRLQSGFGDGESFGNGFGADGSFDQVSRPSQFDSDGGVSVIHSPRNLLAIEVLPFLGLITRFRQNLTLNVNHKPFHSNDDEGETISKFTKFNYPKNNQNQEMDEDDIGDGEAEEGGIFNGSNGDFSKDDGMDQRKNQELVNQHFNYHDDQIKQDEKLWFEDEDDIIND